VHRLGGGGRRQRVCCVVHPDAAIVGHSMYAVRTQLVGGRVVGLGSCVVRSSPRYGETALSSEASTSAGVLEALEDSQCDVSLLNYEIRDGVRICGLSVDRDGSCPGVKMGQYQPRVVRSKKGAIQAWGVRSELRPEWSERGFIVQHATEVLLPARDQSVAVVRKYTQAWKVCRLKGRMQTVGQGKSVITVGVSDLRVSGQRWYRFKAFFVARGSRREL
jgi:hypothetical protein